MMGGTMGVSPDGGWGWWVVLSVFISNVLQDGTIGTFGIFYPFVMADFNASPALTSLTGSLVPAVYMMSAPIVGGLIHRFDCRRVSVAGGIVAACGLVVASMSQSSAQFAVTYGVLGGIGIGMNSLCGHLIINTYFNKKRGMANGIVQSGAGMGVFILAPMLQYLLKSYSWRGTMMIYSGCILQYCVCGMLMRPLTVSSGPSSEESSDTNVESGNGDSTGTEHEMEDINTIPHQQPLLKTRALMLLQEEVHVKPKYFHSQKVTQNQSNGQTCSRSHIDQNNKIINQTQGHSLPDISVNHIENEKGVHIYTESRNGYKPCLGNSYNILHEAGNVRSPRRHVLHPLDRKDIFYSGSICNLKEYKDTGSIEQFIHDMTADTDTESTSDTHDIEDTQDRHSTHAYNRPFRGVLGRFVDVSVFRNTVYVPVLLGGMFVQMGQFIPSTFLPNYCYSIGLTGSDVTTILSTYGILNIAGRLVAGVLANLDSISSLWLCTFGNFMCGVACGIFPFCTNVISLCVFAAVFGFFIGFFGPLQVIIMVEYLGLEKLTSAMGILQLVKGPAALFGPPLAGLVYQWTENYGISMVVAAAMFVTSALCQSSVPLINKCTGQHSGRE